MKIEIVRKVYQQLQDEKDCNCKKKEQMDAPCWDDYEQVGTKIVDGKEVPNCVPKK